MSKKRATLETRERFKTISYDGWTAKLPNLNVHLGKWPDVIPCCAKCGGTENQTVYAWFQYGIWKNQSGLLTVCPDCWHTTNFWWYTSEVPHVE